MMRQSMFLIAILLLAWVAAGCNPPSPVLEEATPTSPPPPTSAPPSTQTAPQDVSWQNVQQAGVLRVGTTADYPPFEYYNENLQLDGFDIALIQQIGQRLGLKVELNNFAFDGLPAAVAVGQVDVAIGALSVTPERQAIADFSNVYYAGSDAVLSRPEADPAKIQDPTALAAARLGVNVNSIYQTYAQEELIDTGLMPKQNLLVYPDISQAVNDLKAKRIDAVWMDLKPAQAYLQAGGVKVLVQDMNQQLYAIAMKKGADALRDKINEALTQLQNDGTLANLQVQYLGLDPEDVVTPQPLPTPAAQPTPPPPACLDNAEWIEDLSYDDKDHTKSPELYPGEHFTKGWRMRNNGTCTWKNGYTLAIASANQPAAYMGGQPIPVTKDVKPGEMYDFQVNLIAPVVPGNYIANWVMHNAQNERFGETVWVDITVPGVPTITPKPTLPPVASVTFEAQPTTINEGESVLFVWNTENAKEVYFYRDGQKWSDHPAPEDAKETENPPYTMNYYLRVIQLNGSVIERSIWITVKPAPVEKPDIEYISASPPQILIGECTRVDWSVRGKVDWVTLLVNDSMVWDGAPIAGNYQDCPDEAGRRVYTLQASGPGGTNTESTAINVNVPPPTEEPDRPDVPTEVPPPVIDLPAIQHFEVVPDAINTGECVTASWSTGGGTTRIQLWRDADVIYEGQELNLSVQECMLPAGPASVHFTLVAYNNADQSVEAEDWVEVAPAAALSSPANTNWLLLAMQGLEMFLQRLLAL